MTAFKQEDLRTMVPMGCTIARSCRNFYADMSDRKMGGKLKEAREALNNKVKDEWQNNKVGFVKHSEQFKLMFESLLNEYLVTLNEMENDESIVVTAGTRGYIATVYIYYGDCLVKIGHTIHEGQGIDQATELYKEAIAMYEAGMEYSTRKPEHARRVINTKLLIAHDEEKRIDADLQYQQAIDECTDTNPRTQNIKATLHANKATNLVHLCLATSNEVYYWRAIAEIEKELEARCVAAADKKTTYEVLDGFRKKLPQEIRGSRDSIDYQGFRDLVDRVGLRNAYSRAMGIDAYSSEHNISVQTGYSYEDDPSLGDPSLDDPSLDDPSPLYPVFTIDPSSEVEGRVPPSYRSTISTDKASGMER